MYKLFHSIFCENLILLLIIDYGINWFWLFIVENAKWLSLMYFMILYLLVKVGIIFMYYIICWFCPILSKIRIYCSIHKHTWNWNLEYFFVKKFLLWFQVFWLFLLIFLIMQLLLKFIFLIRINFLNVFYYVFINFLISIYNLWCL